MSFRERLLAAEAEIQRLDELLARALGTVRTNDLAAQAQSLEEEQERDRITPFTIRPSVERPLNPDEIPVRTVFRRPWWR